MTRVGRLVTIPEHVQHGTLHRAVIAYVEKMWKPGHWKKVYWLDFPCGARSRVRVPARFVERMEWPRAAGEPKRCKECFPDA